jgi:D-alanine-D-alanine ligase
MSPADDWARAAALQRQRLARLAPRLAILYGAMSAEDRVYLAATPEGTRSYDDLSAALHGLGAGWVRAYDAAASADLSDDLGKADLTLLNLHGEPGEDGTLQGWLRFHGIPFAGADVEASVVGLNKHLTKLVAAAAGVRTPPYRLFSDGRPVGGGHPLSGQRIRKPVRGGSSLGVARMAPAEEPPERGDWLVEEYLPGVDATATVVEVDGRPAALPAVVLDHTGEIYGVDAKLAAPAVAKARAVRPAGLRAALAECERLAVTVHTSIGARHLSRSDFRISDGRAYFLEINTIPGLSAVSNVAECAYAAGLSYPDLVAVVVGAALPEPVRGPVAS